MRIELQHNRTDFPPFIVTPRRKVLVLNTRERTTLRTAARIAERARNTLAKHGLDEHPFADDLGMLEVTANEVADTAGWDLERR